MKRTEKLARLAALEATMHTTKANADTAQALLTDLARQGISAQAHAHGALIVAQYQDVADAAEALYLTAYDAAHPQAHKRQYRVTGEAYLVQPA